jgi:hypothetical protein
MTDNELGVIEPITVLICDDIRIENNGKALLIGVYSDAIAISDFPANLKLSFWTTIEVLKVGSASTFQFRVMHGPDENIIAEMKGEFQTKRLGVVSFDMGSIPFQCEKAGWIELQYLNDDEKWIPVVRKMIISIESISSIE